MKLKYILIHNDDAVLVKCTQSFSLCAKLLCEKIMPEVRYKSNKKKPLKALYPYLYLSLFSGILGMLFTVSGCDTERSRERETRRELGCTLFTLLLPEPLPSWETEHRRSKRSPNLGI